MDTMTIDFMVLGVCALNVILAIGNRNMAAVGGWFVACLGWVKVILSALGV